jgi:hypothetical protein
MTLDKINYYTEDTNKCRNKFIKKKSKDPMFVRMNGYLGDNNGSILEEHMNTALVIKKMCAESACVIYSTHIINAIYLL